MKIYVELRVNTSKEYEYSKIIKYFVIIASDISLYVVIFQVVFLLQWMQFSQHSEAIPFYHGHSNPIGRAVEISHISIYTPGLHSTCLPGEPDRHIFWKKKFSKNNFLFFFQFSELKYKLSICSIVPPMGGDLTFSALFLRGNSKKYNKL